LISAISAALPRPGSQSQHRMATERERPPYRPGDRVKRPEVRCQQKNESPREDGLPDGRPSRQDTESDEGIQDQQRRDRQEITRVCKGLVSRQRIGGEHKDEKEKEDGLLGRSRSQGNPGAGRDEQPEEGDEYDACQDPGEAENPDGRPIWTE